MSERTPRQIDPPAVYVCCQPIHAPLAARIASPGSEPAIADYHERTAALPGAPESERVRQAILAAIDRADVVVCLIGEMTRTDVWIDWELNAARAAARPPGLVGVLLQPWCVRPKAIMDTGAIFVPFKRDAVERAIRWAAEKSRKSGDFELVDD